MLIMPSKPIVFTNVIIALYIRIVIVIMLSLTHDAIV